MSVTHQYLGLMTGEPEQGYGPGCQPEWAAVANPGIFFVGGPTNSVEDRGQTERGCGGGSPLVRGSGGSCNLVQEISFHMVIFSSFLVL